MRKTIGTSSRAFFPPSRKALEEAASVPHPKGKGTNKLSVAAKARAKHAHRGKDRFYGIATGKPESQNKETVIIIKKLLKHAAWVNIHVFGGVSEDRPVLEVRLDTGYGARWVADWSEPHNPLNVEFWGFLEPRMPDGHEKRWLH
jgi:hypothetical protein